MKNLYNAIIERIEQNKELYINRGLTPPVTVDIYAGQPDAPELFEFFTPALFFDYNIKWEHGNRDEKKGVINFDLHILLDPVPGTANYNLQKTDGLKKLEFYELTGSLIDGMKTDTTGTVALIGEEPAQTDFYCYQILHFTGSISRSLRPPLKKVSAKPDIKVNEK